MKTHAFEPHPVWQTRNMCEFKWDDDGRVGYCGLPRSDLVHQEGAAEDRGATTQNDAAQETASKPVVAPAGTVPTSPALSNLRTAWRAMKMVDDAYWGDFCGCCGVILSLESQDDECGPQHTAVQLVHSWIEQNPSEPP